MYVGACGYSREEELREGESKSVAHCIQQNIWYKKGERIVGEYDGAKRLAKEGKMGPRATEDPVPGLEVKEDDRRRVKVNVEAIL